MNACKWQVTMNACKSVMSFHSEELGGGGANKI